MRTVYSVKPLQNQQRACETCQQEMPTYRENTETEIGRHKETIHLEMTFKTGERKTNDF